MTQKNTRRFLGIGIVLSLALTLAACGGGGGGGAGGGVGALLGFKSAEGSKSAPLNLGDLSTTGVVTHEGEVAGGGLVGIGDTPDSYYLVTGVVPGVVYTVTMGNLSDDADVYVYQGDPSFASTPADRVSIGTTTETFTITADPDVTSFFIGVDSSSTEKGAGYTLSVLVKPITEGAPDAPVGLYNTPILRAGSTVGYDTLCTVDACGATGGDSFYIVTLQPDTGSSGAGGSCQSQGFSPCRADYLISLSALTDDVDLYVFKDDGAVPGQAELDGDGNVVNSLACTPSTHEALAIETCLVSTTSTNPSVPVTVIIAVDGHYAAAGAAYTLNVIRKPSGPNYFLANDPGQCHGFPCNMNTVPGGFPGELFIKNPNDNDNTTSVAKESSGSTVVEGIGACNTTPVLDTDGNAFTELTNRNGCTDSFYSAHTQPGRAYRLYIEKMTDQADLWVFGKDNSFTTPICQPPYAREDVQACTFTASGNKVYFAVDGSHTAAGASYTMGMLPAFVVEGTKASPKLLVDAGITPLPFQGIGTVLKDDVLGVSTEKDSYYMVTGLAPGEYVVSIPALSDDVNLYVFGDDASFGNDLLNFPEPACVSFRGGGAAENCVVTITGTTLYFGIDGYLTRDGGAYVLGVSSLSPEGSVGSPQDLGGAPASYFGHAVTGSGTQNVNDANDSYYKVSVTAGKGYRVDIRLPKDENEDTTNKVSLRVYDNSGFSSLLCDAEEDSNGETRCTAVPTGSTLYFVVDGKTTGSIAPFTTYQIEVREDGGSSAVTIPLTGVTTLVTGKTINPGGQQGAFGDPSDRYFKFAPASASTKYRITLQSLTQDVDLYVFRGDISTNFFQQHLCQSKTVGTGNEVCQTTFANGDITADPATQRIYIGVDGFPASALATFSILIEELP